MKNRSHIYVTVALIIVAVLCIGQAVQVLAAEGQQQSENKVVRFFKNVINWPFGIAKKSSEAVGRTTKKAAITTTTTASCAVETVTGKPEKIKDVVVEPVKGSGETAYTAVEGSVKAPIEGTKEAFE